MRFIEMPFLFVALNCCWPHKNAFLLKTKNNVNRRGERVLHAGLMIIGSGNKLSNDTKYVRIT